MSENRPLVETRNLCKYFDTPRGQLHAVEEVNLSIKAGETLGVVGESMRQVYFGPHPSAYPTRRSHIMKARIS